MTLSTLGSAVCIAQSEDEKSSAQHSDKIEVVSYYFGNYHLDKRNEERLGKGWSEWTLVQNAKPRFEGHQQPKVPLWGYTDEANPRDMEQKIDCAVEYGVDVFLFDWYYYDDGPFLERTIDDGFLFAQNDVAGMADKVVELLGNETMMEEQENLGFQRYKDYFKDLPEIEMMPIKNYGVPNYWLSCITLTDECMMNPQELIDRLAKHGIESRRIWKPMHLQPVFKDCKFYSHFNHETESVAEDIFNRGICLPSDTKMTKLEQHIVCEIIRDIIESEEK